MVIQSANSASAKLAQMLDYLKSSGFRLTPQRVAICQILSNCRDHPTAQMVYQRLKPHFPTMSLATVYKTLNRLREMGLIYSLGDANDGKEHFETDLQPHINLICTRCHKIVDFWSAPILKVQKRVESDSGFRLIGSRLVFYGECPDCRSGQGGNV